MRRPRRAIAGLALLLPLWALLAAGAGPRAPAAAPATGGERWLRAAPGHAWSFPRDHYAHPGYRTEWWYLTGHLQEAGAPPGAEPVAFQFTLFRIGLDPGWDPAAGAPGDSTGAGGRSAWRAANLVMGHAATTDPSAGRHVFSETLWRAAAGLGGFGAPGDSLLAWCVAPPGTPGTWAIGLAGGAFNVRARDDHRGLGFDLRCAGEGAPVLQGPGGFSPKDATGQSGSLYYSLPRLAVSGTLRRDGRDVAVSGQAWLDREIFTSTLAPGQAGWDWVSLQLADGRDLMLYRLRAADGTVDFALGTLAAAGGAVVPLPREAWTLEPKAIWRSPATGATYPVAWRLRVPGAGIDAELLAVLPDQENVSTRTGVHYWEGGVRVLAAPGTAQAGALIGRGFVELTGYGEGSRPPV